MNQDQVPFGDLAREYLSIRAEVDAAITRVLNRGWFILGPEVQAFERQWADFCGAQHAVGVGNGTDALRIALSACGVGPGDEVVTTPFTAVPTVTAIRMLGAWPRFADVEPETGNLDPELLECAITERTKAIVPVHLYGSPCRIGEIVSIAAKHGIPVVEDAAQAHGATVDGRSVTTFGRAGCFSFYPSKNLGAYGDAGAIVTDDEVIAARSRMLRDYGQRSRYDHVLEGVNSRLDELQAAVLLAKLPFLAVWNERRRKIAAYYDEALDGELLQPLARPAGSVCHLYVVRSPLREELRSYLAQAGVTTQVHYPRPVHLQPAFSFLGLKEGSFPVAENMARSVLSLPVFPQLSDAEVEHIASCLREFVRGQRLKRSIET